MLLSATLPSLPCRTRHVKRGHHLHSHPYPTLSGFHLPTDGNSFGAGGGGGTVIRYHGWDATPALKGPRETVWMQMASWETGLAAARTLGRLDPIRSSALPSAPRVASKNRPPRTVPLHVASYNYSLAGSASMQHRVPTGLRGPSRFLGKRCVLGHRALFGDGMRNC